MDYLVKWEMDIEEVASPLEAAKEAKAEQLRKITTANVFHVKDKKTGKWVEVDLRDNSVTPIK